MNEQMQNALIEIIKKASDGIDASVGFLSSEILDVIHQLLMWYAVQGVIYCVMAIVAAFAWWHIEKITLKKLKENDVDSMDIALFYGLLGSVVRLIPIVFICLMANIYWLQIMIAPKIWLIEYAASLAK